MSKIQAESESGNSWADEGSQTNNDYYDEEEEPKTAAEPSAEGDPGDADADEARCRVAINVQQTEYEIVKKAARNKLNWKLKYFEESFEGGTGESSRLDERWDVTWHDLGVSPDFIARLHPWQKVNMFAGIQCITRKNHLARNLMRMGKCFPKEFDFFPKTWIVPNEMHDLTRHYTDSLNSKSKVTYIVKPDGLSQGKGIFLTRSLTEIAKVTGDKVNKLLEEHKIDGDKVSYIVQQYIDRPHLVDELKYDLRIYVMLYGVNPLRIYLHKKAFARFCTEPYQKPNSGNLDNCFMHLTNYAINKHADNYEDCEDDDGDAGHKRSLKAVLQVLESEGQDVDLFMAQIRDMIVKTIISGQPELAHLYRSCQPECLDGSMCFQILGFDVLIDKHYKPLLLEVNCSPSFGTDSPLDYKIKKAVIADAFGLLNLSYKKRV